MLIKRAVFRGGAAAAFAMSCVAPQAVGSAARADDFNLMKAEPQVENTASIQPASTTHGAKREEGNPHVVRSGGRLVPVPRGDKGSVLGQTNAVRMNCFPSELHAVLRQIGVHFGGAVVVTSGYRAGGRRGSYHRRCMAADIQIAGVSAGAIARFARTLPQVGGVGTYGHTRSVHVDVGDRDFTWHGGRGRSAALGARGRKTALGGHGCCPICDAMARSASRASGERPRFEARACAA